MDKIEHIQKELDKIKKRNKRVEIDKAWETSIARKIIIALLTYAVIVIFFFGAGLPNPFINSIVPTAGFVLSTLSLPLFKTIWAKFLNK